MLDLPLPLWLIAGLVNSLLAGQIYFRRTGMAFLLWVMLGLVLFLFVFLFYPNSLPQLFAIFWAPVVEEIVFRQGVSPWCERVFRSRFLGIYTSSVFFATLHMLDGVVFQESLDFRSFVGPFILALICDVIYRRGGRLLPCILVHSGSNLFCTIVMSLT